ncbi:MAG: hypoxanthine phosphoribosyltransferase [Taibaiella sp.]|nr:hypoxanthine phosphoribosyltransferase [Taibaiella sp.]
MHQVTIDDKRFELFIDSATIAQKISETGKLIAEEYRGKNPVFLCVLNGAYVFAADLLRQIDITAEVSFIKLRSYAGTTSTGEVKTLIGLNGELKDRHIIVLEDIIDTGKTIHELLPLIKQQSPASVALVCLLSKPEARTHEVTIDYTCFEIPDKFVIGYGLDCNGLGRNLPDIYAQPDDN